MSLARHPIFEATDPNRTRLVRVSDPFPEWLNPFHRDGVIIRAAAIPGEVEHSKAYMARELLLGAIAEGQITSDTVVIEATSGNTGHALAKLCNAIGLRCQLVMPAATPRRKIEAVSAFGKGVEVVLHSEPDESPVQRARRTAAQNGYYNPDQYANWRNPWAHKTYLAPQLFAATGEVSLLAVAAGSMGTCMGLRQYVVEHGLDTQVLPVAAEEGDDVPGARPLSKIERDVTLPWEEIFEAEEIVFGTRGASLLLAFCSWRFLHQSLGPSFGLAFQGALRKLNQEKTAGRLDQLRVGGKVDVVILGADGYLPYLEMFAAAAKADARHAYDRPDLLECAL